MDPAGVRRLAAHPAFRALWIGQLVSIFGDRFHYLALLALLVERAREPSNPAPELALVPLVSFLPAIFLGPVAGPLVDRWNTKRVLVVSDAARGVLALALIPAAAWGGLPAAFGLVLLLFVANAFFLPARSAILPEIVPAETLVAANSLATFAGVLATLAGTLVGGWVVERVGWRWGFAIDSATYFLSVAALAAIPYAARPSPRPAGPRAGLGQTYRELARSLEEGIRIAAAERRVLGAIAALVLLWSAGGVLHVAGTVLVQERTTGVVSGVGSLLAAVSLGMVLGTAITSVRGHRWRGGVVAATGLLGIGLALAAFAFARHPAGLHAAAFGAGAFVALLLVATEATIQRAVRPGALGRVFALRDLATRVAVLAVAGATGALVGRGALASAGAVLTAGVVLIAAAAGGLLLSVRRRWRG